MLLLQSGNYFFDFKLHYKLKRIASEYRNYSHAKTLVTINRGFRIIYAISPSRDKTSVRMTT